MSNYEGICANCVHYTERYDVAGEFTEACYLSLPPGLIISLELTDKLDYSYSFPTKAEWTCSFGEEIKED